MGHDKRDAVFAAGRADTEPLQLLQGLQSLCISAAGMPAYACMAGKPACAAGSMSLDAGHVMRSTEKKGTR